MPEIPRTGLFRDGVNATGDRGFLDRTLETWQLRLGDCPDGVEIDAEVVVNDLVPRACDPRPADAASAKRPRIGDSVRTLVTWIVTSFVAHHSSPTEHLRWEGAGRRAEACDC